MVSVEQVDNVRVDDLGAMETEKSKSKWEIYRS